MKSDIQIRFGELVRDHRKRMGWTQEALADAAGLHATYISGIETGSRNPSLTAIVALANGFGLTLAQMVNGLQTSTAVPD